MRDHKLMIETLRMIRANGGRATVVKAATSELRRWYVHDTSDIRLNGQIVSDLLNDGWLALEPSGDVVEAGSLNVHLRKPHVGH